MDRLTLMNRSEKKIIIKLRERDVIQPLDFVSQSARNIGQNPTKKLMDPHRNRTKQNNRLWSIQNFTFGNPR